MGGITGDLFTYINVRWTVLYSWDKNRRSESIFLEQGRILLQTSSSTLSYNQGNETHLASSLILLLSGYILFSKVGVEMGIFEMTRTFKFVINVSSLWHSLPRRHNNMWHIDRIRTFTTSVFISGMGWEAAEMIGVKIIASLGLLSDVTAATLVWIFLLAYFTPPPAFLAGFLFPVSFLSSLFC